MIESNYSLHVGLYETNGKSLLADGQRFDLIQTLLDKGYSVSIIRSLEQISSLEKDRLLLLGHSAYKPLLVEKPENQFKTVFRDVDGLRTDQIIDAVDAVREEAKLPKLGGWKPWFPVIDYERCTNCMQCLSFCLFDVYGVSEGKIQVQNESNCKTDCPACSRVCPEVAILFPKYKNGPINGDVVRPQDIQREAMKVDISALLGGDLYNSLRMRQKDARKRFSTERDESRALLERKKCLRKLKKNFDIPDEVLMSLPSAGDIQVRAERAKAKAVARQARSQTLKDEQPSLTEDDWGI